MSSVDYGDYTITTTITPNGRTDQITWKPGTVGANQQAIMDKAALALTVNAAFLALPTPTQAQAVTQVQRLTRECNGLIRLLLSQLTDVSDT